MTDFDQFPPLGSTAASMKEPPQPAPPPPISYAQAARNSGDNYFPTSPPSSDEEKGVGPPIPLQLMDAFLPGKFIRVFILGYRLIDRDKPERRKQQSYPINYYYNN